jgi:Holliday junction resolvase RusA-like endonuclease
MNLPDNPLESFRKRNAHLYPGVVALEKHTANAAPGITKKAGPAPVSLRIVICGIVRGGKNNICITRTGHRFPNKKWAQWRDEAVTQVKDQLKLGFQTITEPVNVRLTYVAENHRRHDMPAILDSIFHLLERAKVVEDDVQIWVTESSRSFDKDSPRCEIQFL